VALAADAAGRPRRETDIAGSADIGMNILFPEREGELSRVEQRDVAGLAALPDNDEVFAEAWQRGCRI
jgi:hypothetical protein